MEKEIAPKTDGGYSEKEIDKAIDKMGNVNQIKAKNIFDSKKKYKKTKEKVILDSQSQ